MCVHQTRSNKMNVYCGARDSTIISKSFVNLMYGHQKRSNKMNCVSWNKGFNHNKQKLCELKCMDIKQEATKNKMCIVEQGTLQ